jgi:hypothetical protein
MENIKVISFTYFGQIFQELRLIFLFTIHKGVAFQGENLKKGPIFAAVSLLHCAGCKIVNGIPAPSYFLR